MDIGSAHRARDGRGAVRGRASALRRGLLVVPASVLAAAVAGSCQRASTLARVPVAANQEDRTAEGGPYSASTQSFLRGSHWLERVDHVELRDTGGLGTLVFSGADAGQALSVTRLPLEMLVPRLHYAPHDPPDAFDAFNLMLAEYSRNGQSVPWAEPDDTLAHFEAPHLLTETPYTLRADYDFVPEPLFRPLRVAVVNNCLEPGLWELIGFDRVGEIYHAWFRLPVDVYSGLVARVNGVEPAFAARALKWSIEPVPLDLDRLRRASGPPEDAALALIGDDDPVGYSTQDSRQKVSKGFAEIVTREGEVAPARRGDFTRQAVSLSEFVPPGKYSRSKRRRFDLGFLRATEGASVSHVAPLTDYAWRAAHGPTDPAGAAHVELRLRLGQGRSLVLGNLPLALLVPQEDLALHGFGVGILPADNPAERTRLLFDRGPAPSYAYVVEERGGRELALNSHDFGIEQVFIRARPEERDPHWEVTVASYERIVDLVRYRVGMPAGLVAEARAAAAGYVSPSFFTYRDDNTR